MQMRRWQMAVILAMITCASAQAERTVGLLHHGDASTEGYTLFSPMNGLNTFLVDHDGRAVHSWTHTRRPGHGFYLLEDGSLLRAAIAEGNSDFIAGGAGGQIERWSWDGNLEWSFRYSEEGSHKAHHDIAPLPNGNVLILAWEMRDENACIAAGRDPSTLQEGELWPEHIIEVQPTGLETGDIVWEWHAWDHLVQDFDSTKPNYGDPTDYPGKIDINYRSDDFADWHHVNSLDYNAALDQIVMSVHRTGEIWVIDHGTTTEEAQGTAGDLLYRWGNAAAWSRDASEQDRILYGQHDARWIPEGYPGAGRIMIFNNGNGRPEGSFSTVEEIISPVLADGSYELPVGGVYGPAASELVYMSSQPEDFAAMFISGAHRLPSGNTLICSGPWGEFFEVTPDGVVVWRYINPVVIEGPLYQGELPPMQGGLSTSNRCFRATRYLPDDPAFDGVALIPGNPIELYDEEDCLADLGGNGSVEIADLLHVLSYWETGAGDVQGDGLTDISDVLLVIAAWGQCL